MYQIVRNDDEIFMAESEFRAIMAAPHYNKGWWVVMEGEKGPDGDAIFKNLSYHVSFFSARKMARRIVAMGEAFFRD